MQYTVHVRVFTESMYMVYVLYVVYTLVYILYTSAPEKIPSEILDRLSVKTFKFFRQVKPVKLVFSDTISMCSSLSFTLRRNWDKTKRRDAVVDYSCSSRRQKKSPRTGAPFHLGTVLNGCLPLISIH